MTSPLEEMVSKYNFFSPDLLQSLNTLCKSILGSNSCRREESKVGKIGRALCRFNDILASALQSCPELDKMVGVHQGVNSPGKGMIIG